MKLLRAKARKKGLSAPPRTVRLRARKKHLTFTTKLQK